MLARKDDFDQAGARGVVGGEARTLKVRDPDGDAGADPGGADHQRGRSDLDAVTGMEAGRRAERPAMSVRPRFASPKGEQRGGERSRGRAPNPDHEQPPS